ncbi:MAG: glucose-6-phosphate dehydrogenase assembly protein OpcA, partial [Parachlamydiaceae bacterium]
MEKAMILSDPSKIESQLTKLFAEQGIKSRASLFNLIVYVTADDRAKYIKSLLGKLTEKFPCRILFLHVKPNHKIEFKISADVKENIPCDFIEIYLSQEDERKASFLLLPLLIPDIPIFALWGDDPTLDKTILPALYPYIDRIVFDSFCIKDIRAFA